MSTPLRKIFGVLALLSLLFSVRGADEALRTFTTRQQTIRPVAIPPGTPPVLPNEVARYGAYSAWQTGPGEDAGRRFDLMPAGYSGAPHTARLMSFFSMSDIHITDKESPAQVPYYGWNAPFLTSGLYSQAYSPVLLSTTQVLDAAVKTVNALHRQSPFAFGLMLGDLANSSQFNELRWFIDVLDGKPIMPASGAQLGASTIGYQKPFQAAGLDRSIPWYAVLGNHDEFWMGVNFPSEKLRSAMVGSAVLNLGPSLFAPNATDLTGVYVGVVDGTTQYGDVIKGGPQANFATPPTVVADSNRRPLATADSFSRNFIEEFFNTASTPLGHGFNRTGRGSTAACYTFEPTADLPLKVIVLDDTCKTINPAGGPAYYGYGWIDAERLAWLTDELQKGQDAGQLMIVACHIPINPQKDLFDPTPAPQFYPTSPQNDAQLIATLHRYPNLILLLAGHRHINAVTPQPSPDPAHPEYGFWEVETPSLRDFPRQFRTFDLRRNRDHTLSIVTTDVDPVVESGTPAADSLGYAVGAYRIFGNGTLTDATSHAYNAELVKPLTPAMQAKLAGYGTPVLRAVNFSTLGRIDGAHPLVAGFVIEEAPRRVLIRAVGPALGTLFGLTGGITDPQFTLIRTDGPAAGVIGGNNNWLAADAAVMALAGAFPLPPGSNDAAAVFTLSPGTYTAIVSPADGQAGPTLVELYDVDGTAPGGIANFSTRGWIGSGGSLTPGVVTVGTGAILVRAIGPGLNSSFGLPNTLADPRLELWPGGATLAATTNDDWSAPFAAVMTQAGAFPLVAGSKDAALVIDAIDQGSRPQGFTVPARTLTGASGECLLEFYLIK